VALAEIDQELPEAAQRIVRRDAVPVQPGDLVVLVPGVVVAVLRASCLVAGKDHRDAFRHQQQHGEVAELTLPERLDSRVVGLALGSAVPAQVVVRAVPVLLSVRLVVLAVVRDEVVEREPVVARDEVDAGERRSSGPLIQVGAARNARGDCADEPGVAAHEPADVVAEAAVPLRPASPRERAELVEAPGIPGLGDELRVTELVRKLSQRHYGRVLHHGAVGRSRQHRSEVEPEAVDVVRVDPVAEAVEHQLRADRVVDVERVAAPGEVEQLARIVRRDHVVGVVRQPAQADRRPVQPGLARVVEDDVEDHLEAGTVERLHEVAELADRAVPVVRSEVSDRVVAPVVAVGRVELEHRQELDSRDAEVDQIRDFLLQARKGRGPRDARVGRGGEAADVELVDDRLVQRPGERPVALPVVGAEVDDRCAERGRHVVALRAGCASVPERGLDVAGVRIEQDLLRIEVEGRAEGAGGAKRIPGAGGDARNERVPEVKVALEWDDLGRLRIRRLREQQQIHRVGVLGEHGEVHTAVDDVRADGMRLSGLNHRRTGAGRGCRPALPRAEAASRRRAGRAASPRAHPCPTLPPGSACRRALPRRTPRRRA
jgi:hypothetical protein